VGAGHMARLTLDGIKPERAPVLPGGFAIMSAAMAELSVPRLNPVGGALRLGVLYDLLGRTGQRDSRVVTVERFQERYHVDRAHASRVANMARTLYLKSAPHPDQVAAQRVEWAGLLHEIGYTVSHIGYHKHGAYILENADMPGFSAQEQRQLAVLVHGCRGGLSKMEPALHDANTIAQVLALRLAVLFHHARRAIDAPRITLKSGRTIHFGVSVQWLKRHPLTLHLLVKEREEWAALGVRWRSP
jgi:exopolyphosphatase/guanosine-5'-triphosphate,3'-diphosphate pyrophosphatase